MFLIGVIFYDISNYVFSHIMITFRNLFWIILCATEYELVVIIFEERVIIGLHVTFCDTQISFWYS